MKNKKSPEPSTDYITSDVLQFGAKLPLEYGTRLYNQFFESKKTPRRKESLSSHLKLGDQDDIKRKLQTNKSRYLLSHSYKLFSRLSQRKV